MFCCICIFAPYFPDLVAGKMAVLRIIRIVLYFVLYLYYVLSYPGLQSVTGIKNAQVLAQAEVLK